MQIIEMGKGEKGTQAMIGDALGRSLFDIVATELKGRRIQSSVTIQGKFSPRFVETTRQPKAPIEDKSANESSRVEFVRVQVLSQYLHRGRQQRA